MQAFTVTIEEGGVRRYEGPCRVCGADVTVRANFLATSYLTCNMATRNGTPHTGAELRATWLAFAGGDAR